MRKPKVCEFCGITYTPTRSKQKFCSRDCVKKHKASKYEDFKNNPEEILKPESYKDFFTHNMVKCLVKGCNWEGRHLSAHLNNTHGIRVKDFKKIAGFSITKGLVCGKTRENLKNRPQNIDVPHGFAIGNTPISKKRDFSYISDQSRELHSINTIARNKNFKPIKKNCRICGEEFEQKTTTPEYYCSKSCRSKWYYRPREEMICSVCGTGFIGDTRQKAVFKNGGVVCCSIQCRNQNAANARKTDKSLKK